MQRGDQVKVTGAREFAGQILSINPTMLIVGMEGKRSITLRRFPESTTPEQWRIGGLPVEVREAVNHADLDARLARLVERARAEEEAYDKLAKGWIGGKK